MIYRDKKTFPKKLIITGGLAILLVTGALIYVYAFNGNLLGWTTPKTATSGNSTVDYGPATYEQKKSGSQIKSDSLNNQQDSPKAPANDKSNVSVLISSANQRADGSLDIRTSISAIDDSGNCTLTLTKKGSATITQTAGTQVITSYSACNGFSIPKAQIDSGTWMVQINYEGKITKGAASTSVEIN